MIFCHSFVSRCDFETVFHKPRLILACDKIEDSIQECCKSVMLSLSDVLVLGCKPLWIPSKAGLTLTGGGLYTPLFQVDWSTAMQSSVSTGQKFFLEALG
jgi:hypothetical protein